MMTEIDPLEVAKQFHLKGVYRAFKVTDYKPDILSSYTVWSVPMSSRKRQAPRKTFRHLAQDSKWISKDHRDDAADYEQWARADLNMGSDVFMPPLLVEIHEGNKRIVIDGNRRCLAVARIMLDRDQSHWQLHVPAMILDKRHNPW